MLSIFKKIPTLVVLFLMPAISAAADATSGARHLAGSENPISPSNVIQILASFIAVIAFIFFMAWLARKTGRFGISNNKSIRIVSSMSLGMREKIVLLNVEDVNIVVGVAPGQIRTLYVLGKSPTEPDQDVNKNSNAFARMMGGFLK